MKMNSIHFKVLSTILAAILAIAVFIGGLSVYRVDTFIQEETENYIRVFGEKEEAQVNDIFGDMENSVKIMSSYILAFSDSVADYANRDNQNEIIETAGEIFADVAKNTIGAVAYYVRFAVDISDTKSGFFITKTQDCDDFINYEITDLALYDKGDTEHVGWYWQPYEAGEPIWMKPYFNQNNGFMMISYVIPLYCEDQFIGVVGMDFDYTVLIEKVHNIRIYENGFAHLELDGVPIHQDVEDYNPEDYLQVSNELMNGMTLVVSASYDDIRQVRYDFALRIVHTVVVLAAVFCLISIAMVGKIVKPLKELTEASKKLAEGDYEVEPVQSNTYEIQLLSTAFDNMTMHLREHERLQYILAYCDSLTGLKNTTAYKVWVNDLNKEIQDKNAVFGVIVLDVNYLKETNDKYGHEVGNQLIITAAQLISGVFKRSPVFRIGGDEFLAILQNRDLENCEELCEEFDSECASTFIETDQESIPVRVAKGLAKFEPATDTQFLDVFNRADDAMYQNKRKMKADRASQ